MAGLRNRLPAKALQDACGAVALDPSSFKALHKRGKAKQELRLWQSARDDLARVLELMPAADKQRGEVARDMADCEAAMQRAAARAAERAAAAAAAKPRITQYRKAGVTIEEHADEPEEDQEDQPGVPPEEAADWEAEALRRVPALRAAGEAARAEWLAARDEEAREVYRRETLAWAAAVERAEAAAAAEAERAAAAEAEREQAAAAAAAAAAVAAAPATQVPAQAQAAPAAAAAADGGWERSELEALKDAGNAHFGGRRFAEAEACWAECLRRDPAYAAVHLNLIALFNATGRHAQAEAQATTALQVLDSAASSLDPAALPSMRSKALHRRHMARRSLGRLEAALEDLRAAKSCLGQSPQLDMELEALGLLLLEKRKAAAEAEAARVEEAEAARVAEAKAAVAEVEAEVPAPAPVAPAPVAPAPASPAPAAAAAPAEARTPAAAASARPSGPAPQRKVMKIEEESDDSDEEAGPAPSQPAPPAPSAPPAAPVGTAAASTASAPASAPGKPAAKVEEAPAAPPSTAASATTQPAAVPPAQAPSSTPAAAAPSAAPAAPATTPVPTATARVQPPAPTPAPAPASTAAADAAKPGVAKPVPTTTAAAGGGSAGDAGDRAEADRLREEGNRLYGVGNYVRAGDLYSRSIAACAHNPAAYCNRAFVYLHVKRPADALLDAEAAIEQAGGRYPKAQLRRSQALRDLGRLDDAMAELKKLLAEAPNDAALQEELRNMQRLAAAARGGGAAAGAGPGKPVQAPPVRHKIMVEQEESDDEELLGGTSAPAAAAASASAKPGSAKAAAPAPSANGGAAATPSPPAATPAVAAPASNGTTPAADAQPSSSSPSPSSPAAAARSSLHEAASAKAAAALASKVPKRPKAPKNAHELEQALKSLAGHPAVLYDYIRSLDPASYAGVIKANLSVKTIQAIVDTARHVMGLGAADAGGADASSGSNGQSSAPPAEDDVGFVVKSLEGLTLVPRFDMTYGLAGKAVKEDVKAVVGAVAAAGKDVSLLRKSYKV